MEKFLVRTKLNVALKRFREDHMGREKQLQNFASTVATALDKKAPIVRITDDATAGMQFTNSEGGVELLISDTYVNKVLKWEEEVADNGSAAIFGGVVRAMSKDFGSHFGDTAMDIAHMFLNEWPSAAKEGTKSAHLVNQISADIAAFCESEKHMHELLKEMPGLGDAVAASFITNALPDPEQFGPQGFTNPDRFIRWGVIWSALVMEMVGQGTEDSIYPDEKTAEIVREVARNLPGNMHPHREAVKLAPLLVDEDEDEPDMDESTPPPQQSNEQIMTEGQDTAAIAIVTGSKAPEAADIKTEYTLWPRNTKGQIVATSSIEQELKDALSDFRMDTTTGQFSGELRQPARLLTDQRVFAKRRKVVDPVAATVIVCVDESGSMSGARSQSAYQIHDALCYALAALEIRVFSCGYSGILGTEYVQPVNVPGEHIRSITRGGMPGGNGDDAALTWATDILLDEATERQAIVFLADGEFNNSTVSTFHQRVKDLDVSVFHVDYTNKPISPFGGKSIQAGGKSLRDVAGPLAAGLAEALGLD